MIGRNRVARSLSDQNLSEDQSQFIFRTGLHVPTDSHTIPVNARLAMAEVVFFWIVLCLNIVDRSTLAITLNRDRKILNLCSSSRRRFCSASLATVLEGVFADSRTRRRAKRNSYHQVSPRLKSAMFLCRRLHT